MGHYYYYTKDNLLNYITFCRQQVDDLMPVLDLNAGSGFHWLPMPKAEVQFYSLRHLQTHIGELAGRLWVAAGNEIDWVGMGPFAFKDAMRHRDKINSRPAELIV